MEEVSDSIWFVQPEWTACNIGSQPGNVPSDLTYTPFTSTRENVAVVQTDESTKVVEDIIMSEASDSKVTRSLAFLDAMSLM